MSEIGQAERTIGAGTKRVGDDHLLRMTCAEIIECRQQHVALIGSAGAVKRVAHQRIGVEQAQKVADLFGGRYRAPRR